MAERWQHEPWAKDLWWSGKTTRRRFLSLSAAAAGAVGATMLVPAPWRAAFGAAKSYKIGSEQPLSGAGAAGGKTALVGLQMAVDRINQMGGVMGRRCLPIDNNLLSRIIWAATDSRTALSITRAIT